MLDGGVRVFTQENAFLLAYQAASAGCPKRLNCSHNLLPRRGYLTGNGVGHTDVLCSQHNALISLTLTNAYAFSIAVTLLCSQRAYYADTPLVTTVQRIGNPLALRNRVDLTI